MSSLFPDYWRPIQQELESVIVEQGARLRFAELSQLNRMIPPFGLDFLVPPALVLFSSRLFPEKKKIELAVIFMEIIHMGTILHNLAGRRKGREQQLLILTGDYLLSRLFHLLCESHCLFLLERLAVLITEMNEGFACQEEGKRKNSEPSRDEVLVWLRKQYGAFYGECCALGCLFAGGKPEEQSLMREFGVFLGIAHGVLKSGCESSWRYDYLEKALSVLSTLPESTGRDDLASFARGIVNTLP